jgi:hypothetical protein
MSPNEMHVWPNGKAFRCKRNVREFDSLYMLHLIRIT